MKKDEPEQLTDTRLSEMIIEWGFEYYEDRHSKDLSWEKFLARKIIQLMGKCK